MTTPTKAVSLPDAEVQILSELRSESLPLLRARVSLLRDAGWSLAQIGEPIGKNRSSTRLWEKAALPEHLPLAADKGPVPEPPVKSKDVRVINLYPDVPEAKRQELHDLAEKARHVRGWTPEDDEGRVAAAKLENLLEDYNEIGVPNSRLATCMGVTHRAVAARLERVVARRTAPKPHEITIEEAARGAA